MIEPLNHTDGDRLLPPQYWFANNPAPNHFVFTSRGEQVAIWTPIHIKHGSIMSIDGS